MARRSNRIRVNGRLYEAVGDDVFAEMDEVEAPSGYKLDIRDVGGNIRTYTFSATQSGIKYDVNFTLVANHGSYDVKVEIEARDGRGISTFPFKEEDTITDLDDFNALVEERCRYAGAFIETAVERIEELSPHGSLELIYRSNRLQLEKACKQILDVYGLEDITIHRRNRRS